MWNYKCVIVKTTLKHQTSLPWRLFRNVPGSKWRLLSDVLAPVGKTGETVANNSWSWIGLFQGSKCANVPKYNLEFAWGKSVVVAVTPFSLFHILIIILPTEFLHASSAWHKTPTNPSHTRGHAEVSELVGIPSWWHSDSYSIRGNVKFVSPMYEHTPMSPFCYRTVYISLVLRSQPHSPEQRSVFLCRIDAAPRS